VVYANARRKSSNKNWTLVPVPKPKLGKRLIQAAREGVAIARGELDPATHRSFTHQSGPGMFGGRKARAWKRKPPRKK
jgi:hypothetical protein